MSHKISTGTGKLWTLSTRTSARLARKDPSNKQPVCANECTPDNVTLTQRIIRRMRDLGEAEGVRECQQWVGAKEEILEEEEDSQRGQRTKIGSHHS